MIGTTVGKYRIVDTLGRGGMGTVYRAVDQTLDRDVAIKVLNPDLSDPDILKRFRAEAVTLARLNHPGIATIYELHHQDDELLMVMEFVRGETFHDLSDRLGPLAPPQAAHLAMQVLDALGHAHRAGVVHRDLKPANLMITEAGSVKVMDFGIARVLGTEHFTRGGYMMGTPAYMAPEQVLGREIDGRADLYSVGVVLYRLLSSRLPFNADTAISMVQMQISEAPTPIISFRPELPEWCSTIFDRALAKAPGDRFQSAEEFRAALASAVMPQALGEMPTITTPTPPGLLRDPDLTVPHTPTPVRASAALPAAVAASTPAKAPASAVPPAPAPQPTVKVPVTERTTTTVVLSRPHLMALGALALVVTAGIVVLAFAALRGKSDPGAVVPAATTQAAVTPAPAAEPPAATVPDPTPPAAVPAPPSPLPSAVPAAPPTSKPAPAATTVGQTSGTVEKGVATAGAGPSAAKSAGRGASSTGVSPVGSPTRPAPAAVEAPAPAPAPEPAVALPPLSFNQVRLLAADGERGREREGVLQLANGHVAMLAASGGAPMLSMANGAVTGIFYSRSKQPRWRDASGQTIESKLDLGPLGFLRGDRNWIILLTSGEPVILRIEDSALRSVLPALQERTGQKIQR
jgi:serine/threonine-protein kinase